MSIEQFIRVIESDYPDVIWEYDEEMDLVGSDDFFFMKSLATISGWTLSENELSKAEPDEYYRWIVTPTSYF